MYDVNEYLRIFLLIKCSDQLHIWRYHLSPCLIVTVWNDENETSQKQPNPGEEQGILGLFLFLLFDSKTSSWLKQN